MKLALSVLAAIALAIFVLLIPSPFISSEASADRMNGQGNCTGGCVPGAEPHGHRVTIGSLRNTNRGPRAQPPLATQVAGSVVLPHRTAVHL